jgi:steroid delta-isomerase-like uncharacterized protein
MQDNNKAIARRFLDELWNRENFVAVDQLLASDYDGHSSTEIRGPDGSKKFVSKLRIAFPDFQFKVVDQVAEGDKVATRWKICGTHEGEFQGMPPSGKRIEMTGITIFRIAGGKLIEGWTNEDALGVLQQIQAISMPMQG